MYIVMGVVILRVICTDTDLHPSSLTLCIWIRVEQSIGINADVRRTYGFLVCEISLHRSSEAPRQVTWILARRNCATGECRSATEIHMRARGCILSNKKQTSISAHEFAHAIAPLMFESCLSITWIEVFDDWFKNGLWLQRQRHFLKTSRKQHHEEKTCSALQLQQLSPFPWKCHFHRRGQVSFKNVILTEHGRHKKICFLRSMGSKYLSFATPPQWNAHFFFGIYTAEGCKKLKNRFLTEHGKPKKVLYTEHGKHIFEFCNPSRAFCTFFDHEVVTNSVPVELGGGMYIYIYI